MHVISCWLYLKVSANKWFLPLNWASDILKLALKEDMIPKQCIGGSQLMNHPVTDYCTNCPATMVGELMNIRQRLTTILSYDWVAVPLVYTQVISR